MIAPSYCDRSKKKNKVYRSCQKKQSELTVFFFSVTVSATTPLLTLIKQVSSMSKSVSEYNFFDPEVIECPFDFYAAARRDAPVYQLPDTNIFFISRYDDVRKVLKNTAVFSNDFGSILNSEPKNPEATAIYASGYTTVDTMLTLDPPRQRVYRNLVNKVFSNKRVEGMQAYMEQIAEELIDTWVDEGEVDLLNRFCVPFPVWIIADQLGVPRSDLPLFKSWSDAFASRLSQFASEEQEVIDARLIVEFQHYFVDMINKRREDPQDNIISDLAHATIDEGRPLSNEEMLSILQQVLVAGNETSTATIAGGVRNLIQNPDELKKLQSDHSLIPNAVEEILRLETPSCGLWRVVKQDTELQGVAIPAGSMLMVRFASANRDEKVFEDGERMDICRRNADDNLAFGQGVHFCLGAQLARKELNVAFKHLLTRTTNWRLTEDKNNLRHWPNLILRGLEQLHISFDKVV
jgi:cytochrome P450